MSTGQGSGSQVTATSILTLDQVKTHLRVDHDNENDLITRLRDAAVEWAQNFTRRQFISATKTLKLDFFPNIIFPSISNLVSVTSIVYVDEDGDSQTLSADTYDVDISHEPGRIVEAFEELWPTTRSEINAVTVTYIAGYGDSADDTPDTIKTAVLMLIGNWYENRESTITGASIMEVPQATEMMLWPYRVLFEFPHAVQS